MAGRRKEVKVTVNTAAQTVTIRHRTLRYGYRPGGWEQVTLPIRDLTRELQRANIAVPWPDLNRVLEGRVAR